MLEIWTKSDGLERDMYSAIVGGKEWPTDVSEKVLAYCQEVGKLILKFFYVDQEVKIFYVEVGKKLLHEQTGAGKIRFCSKQHA